MRACSGRMRAETRQGFGDMNTRIDGLTHIMTTRAGHIHRHDEHLERLEEQDNGRRAPRALP